MRFSHIVSLSLLSVLLMWGTAAYGQTPGVGGVSDAEQPQVTQIIVEGNEHVSQDRIVLGFGLPWIVYIFSDIVFGGLEFVSDNRLQPQFFRKTRFITFLRRGFL